MYGILVLAGILGLLSTRGRLAIVGLILLALDLIHPEFFTVPFSVQNYGQAPIGMFFLGIITYGCCSFLRPKLWHLGLILLVMSLMSGAERNMLFFVLVALTCLYIGQLEWLCSAVKLPNDYSYGIYIYGWPCQQIVLTFDRHATPYGLAALAIPLAILFAMASWFLIEKPAIGLGKAAIALRPQLRSARRVVVPSV